MNIREQITITYLKIVSDSCFDTTGAASAGLPGLTIGEQIGGMWKSITVNNRILNIGPCLYT